MITKSWPMFTKVQRDRMKELGLLEEQTNSLEEILPGCRAALSKPATRTEVRSKLLAIAKPLQQAKDAIHAVIGGSSAAKMEAYNRILLVAADDDSPGDDAAAKAAESLIGVADLVERALVSLPATQRRSDNANPLPIQRIERALRDGFVRHFAAKGVAMPAYTLSVSRKRPPFPEIAAICYEAIGQCIEPDRAIRKYLVLKTRQRQHPKIKTAFPDQISGETVEIPSSK